MSTKPDVLDIFNSQILTDDRKHYEDAHAKLKGERWHFETVPGYFKQLLEETDETQFNYFDEHLGRMKPWPQIIGEISALNKKSPANVCYKLFLLGRHGQGYHNLANIKYGEIEWNQYWLHRTGDGEITWAPDPELTDLGLSQAKHNHRQLSVELKDGLPLPTQWFSLPFRRSIDTLIGTWDGHVDMEQIKPLIKEDFRETIGVHLCDKRSPRSVIDEKYCGRGFIIEDGFEENDVYFKDDYREKVWEQALRQERGFQYIFDHSDKHADEFVSVTSHSGSIRTQLLVLGHRPFAIGTGGMIPVVVRATKRAVE